MSDAAKPAKGSQKMVIAGTIMLPPGNFFETAKRAAAAQTIVETAQEAIAKEFPGFNFTVDVSPYRENVGGRKKKGEGTAAGANAGAGAPAPGAAPPNGSAGDGGGAPAGGEPQPGAPVAGASNVRQAAR